jgi:hypothetical protein
VWIIIFLIRLYILSALDHPVSYADCLATCAGRPAIWSDCPVLYSDCPALHVNGLKGLFRVCTVHGGSGVGLGNSFLKTGLATAGPDGEHSCADGPVVH